MLWGVKMYIKLNKNEKLNIDTQIEFDSIENTLDICDVTPVNVQGHLQISATEIIYDLSINTIVTIDNNHSESFQKIDLVFKITEIEEINDKNPYIQEKTLDLNGKIWENIVVEVLQVPLGYENDLTSGDGWKLITENDDEIDSRLSPLLKLLDRHEEV